MGNMEQEISREIDWVMRTATKPLNQLEWQRKLGDYDAGAVRRVLLNNDMVELDGQPTRHARKRVQHLYRKSKTDNRIIP